MASDIDGSLPLNTDFSTPDVDGDLAAPQPPPTDSTEQNSVDTYRPPSKLREDDDQPAQPQWSGPTMSASSLSQASSCNVPPALSRGSTGPDVKSLQAMLAKVGLLQPTGVDAIFGPKTEKAVWAFIQTLGRRESSGTMDADAWAKLAELAGKRPLIPKPEVPSDKAPVSLKDLERAFQSRAPGGMPMLNQGAEAWAQEPLGEPHLGGRTIGGAGCCLTSLCMIVSQKAHRDITPKELNDALLKHGAFKGSNINNWLKVEEALRQEFGVNLKAERRVKAGGQTVAALADESLAAGKPLIIGIKYNGQGEFPAHYLTVQRKEANANGQVDYVVLDPAKGAEVRYGLDSQGNFINRVRDDDGRTRVASDVTLLR